jgi:ectoine hydroxylase-related dioxygenase (phytanoyl-CoA dioxygenase family)
MHVALTCDHITAYREYGYLAPLPALARPAAGDYCARLEAFIAAHSDRAATLKRLRAKAHLHCPLLQELVRTPAILDQVADILGADLLCRSVSVFLKEPGAPTYIAWHQDAAYWLLEPPDVLTAWVALTESTVENGALDVLRGSHRRPLLPHGPSGDAANMLSRNQAITSHIDPARTRALLLRPGEMSLHHMGTAHGSGPNRSGARRIGVAIRYVAAHVRNTGARRDSAMLVHGRDSYRNFGPEPEFATSID